MKIKDIKNYSIINESLLLEDPVYRSFKQVGRYIAERRMSEKEILQVFADVEAGMTDPATGANRTMLGRGKDQATKLAASIRDSVNTVLKNIQDSVPVSAVDAIYDQATDAVAKLAGGQKGQVMQAIKKYRMLVKKYPKSAGFAKAALVAITGLATGGASLPAIAGLTYALDAAIKGEKLSSVLGKGAGAAALAWAGQAVAGAVSGTDPAAQGIGISATGAAPAGADPMSNFVTPDKFPTADLPTYTAQAGDNLSKIAARFDVSVGELRGLNPQLADATGATGGQSMNPDVIFPGQEITLPPASGSGTYDGGVGTSAGTQADIASGQVPDSEISRRMAQVRESVNVLVLPMAQLRNQVSTRLLQELNESRGRPNSGLMLTDRGVNTVFENIDRYRRAISELTGVPGSTRPALYRPDAPDAPAPAAKKPGMISRGLSKVGGALSTAGRQFTTNVTKEKLKMNWHTKGKPSDSDQLAAWLAKEQGVPQDVVATVYQKMNIPLAAPAQQTATQPAAGAPATTATQPAAGAPATTATQPPSYNAANVTNMPGMAQNAKPKPANFASPSSYGQTTMSVKAPAAATAPAQAAPAAAADHQPQVGGKIYDAIKRNLAAIDNEEKQDIVSLLQSSSAPAAVTERKKYQTKLDAAVQKESKKKITAKDDPCWSGYHMVGTKKKGNREVPNCVPGKKGA